jgi:hypothetical protein
VVDVSQRCPGNTTFSCGNPPTNGQGPSGTVAMQVFRGTVNLSTAPAPPAAGYVFTMNNIDVNVRNANQNMGGGSAMTLRVVMFPYIDPGTGTALTPNQMCDNSPSFAEPPVALQILNPLDTVTFNNFAFDTDLDSISFHIDFPWTGLFSPMFYNPGFSVTNPWPGILPVITPTGNVAIDPDRGTITFRPTQGGNWLSCIRVDAWRCGQRISSIFRDFQIQIIPSPTGSAPPYNPNNPSPFQQRAPRIQSPYVDSTGNQQWEIYSYYDEDTLIIPISANDSFPFLPSANTFSIAIKSQALSTVNIDSTGCLSPPCATIRGISDPNPPAAITIPPSLLNRVSGLPLGLGYSNILGQGGLKLIWAPQHPSSTTFFNCQSSLPIWHTYRFDIFAIDNHCPAVGETSRTLLVHLTDLIGFQRPRLDSISNQSPNRVLHFDLGIDTLSLDPVDVRNHGGPLTSLDSVILRQRAVTRRINAFRSAIIWKSASRNGPYMEVARITNPFVTTWVDTSSQSGQYFFVETLYGRNSLRTANSDTLPECIFTNIQIVGSTGNFICNGDTATLSSNYSGPNFSFQWFRNGISLTNAINPTLLVVNNPGQYMLRVYDSIQGCFKFSDDFQISFFPPPFQNEQICAVSVEPTTGKNVIVWNKTREKHISKYIILRETSVANQFDAIGAVPFNSFSSFTDTAANPQIRSWRYRIQIEDSCGLRSNLSAIHQTIHLSANLGLNNDVNLIWTPYQGVNYSTHRILRSHNGSPFLLIGSVPSSNFSFTDINAPIGSKAYLIEIEVPGGCSPSARLASMNTITSNLVNLGAGVSLNEVERLITNLQVFPNPSSGIITIKSSKITHEPIPVKILDARGRVVRDLTIPAGEAHIQVDLRLEGAGMYFLRSPTLNWSQKVNLIP